MSQVGDNMTKCDYYWFRHKPDANGERDPCRAFNAGYCEMSETHPNNFDEQCPYQTSDKFWNPDMNENPDG